MKFLGIGSATALTVAVVAQMVGLGMVALPAQAAAHPAKAAAHPAKTAAPRAPDLTIFAGGIRNGSGADDVEGLNGVHFSVSPTSATRPGTRPKPGTCTTAGTNATGGMRGRCRVTVSGNRTRTFTMTGVPTGWFTNPNLARSAITGGSAVSSRPYTTARFRASNTSVIPRSTSGGTINGTARNTYWAVSKDNPPLPSPPVCGRNVALLFDLSTSIGSNLGDLKKAGTAMVSALADTRSEVALYTFGTTAPVNNTNNRNFSLRPAAANESALDADINRFTIQGAQFTNWDQGMWQIADGEDALPGGAKPHYDVAVVITDGDPTVYGPDGIGSPATGSGAGTAVTRFRDIEYGIFSANALKAKNTRVLAVGINASGPSSLNLRAISGTTAYDGSNAAAADYFPTTFAGLGDVLKDIALAGCDNTLTVHKRVIEPDGTEVPGGPGWRFTSSASAAPQTTDNTSAVEFPATAGTIRESSRPGFTPVPGMTRCVETGTTTPPVPVTPVRPNGFTVTPIAGHGISCTFFNRQAGTPTLHTAPSPSSEVGPPPPQTVRDTATLDLPAGVTTIPRGSTVRYRVYASGTADANQVDCEADTTGMRGMPAGGPVPLTGTPVPSSSPVTFRNAGTFYFRAFFTSGETTVLSSVPSVCEPVTVKPAKPKMTTSLSAAPGNVVTINTPVTDSATLSGVVFSLPPPPGTVAFAHFTNPGTCEAALSSFLNTGATSGTPLGTPVTVTGTGTVTVTSNASVSFPSARTVYFAAFYSGNTNNARAAVGCGSEQLTVEASPPEITTAPSPSAEVGPPPQTVTDTATLRLPSGVSAAPAGSTLRYRIYRAGGPDENQAACETGTGGRAAGGPVDVGGATGALPDSDPITFDTAGTFYFRAFFTSGDTTVLHSQASVCEPVTVTPATPMITTHLSPSGTDAVTVGTGVTDSATVAGATTHAGGTITFAYFSDPDVCETALSDFVDTGQITGAHTEVTSGVPVTGDGTYPSGVTTTFDTPTTVYFAAFYSGDANNTRAADGCRSESMTWVTPPPELATVTVNKEWVINGAAPVLDPSQDPDFQASLSLTPSPGGPVTWGEPASGYEVGDEVHIAETDVTIPAGCTIKTSGELGAHTLTMPANTFTVRNTVTCESSLTLVKEISNPNFPGATLPPLTSWTLTARPAPGAAPVISGTTGVTGAVTPGEQFLLAESAVPGFQQTVDPATSQLAPGATGSWRCVQDLPGSPGIEDFDGGAGLVVIQPGQHVTCTAVNLLKRVIPIGPPVTGGGFAPAGLSAPMVAGGLALMVAGVLTGAVGLRKRRRAQRRGAA